MIALATATFFSNASFAFENIDIGVGYFVDLDFVENVSGAGNSGLTQASGFLFAIEQEQPTNNGGPLACVRRFALAPVNDQLAELEQVEVLGTVGAPPQDFEGITWVSGQFGQANFIFALAHETTGNIYLFDMHALLNAPGNEYNVVTNAIGVINTGLWTADNEGLEGIAYDPVRNEFWVAKELSAAGEAPRGIYRVPNNTAYVPPANPIPIADPEATDISGLAVADRYLYVVSEASQVIVRYGIQPNGTLIAQDLPGQDEMLGTADDIIDMLICDRYEGISVDAATGIISAIGENDAADEFTRYKIGAAGLSNDYNNDGVFDAVDIDLLGIAILNGSTDLTFDANGNGMVQANDFNYYVEVFLYTYLGDAVLDRKVDALDLNRVGQNWQQSVMSWADGDFNRDYFVDAQDLNQVGMKWQKKKL